MRAGLGRYACRRGGPPVAARDHVPDKGIPPQAGRETPGCPFLGVPLFWAHKKVVHALRPHPCNHLKNIAIMYGYF